MLGALQMPESLSAVSWLITGPERGERLSDCRTGRSRDGWDGRRGGRSERSAGGLSGEQCASDGAGRLGEKQAASEYREQQETKPVAKGRCPTTRVGNMPASSARRGDLWLGGWGRSVGRRAGGAFGPEEMLKQLNLGWPGGNLLAHRIG